MSDSTKAAHSVALFKREGFLVVELELETVEAYTEERALRIVSAHPWVVKRGLPVLVAWIDDEDALQVHGDEDAVEAAEEMDLEYENIRWSQEITVSWPDVDDEDADGDAGEDGEDGDAGEDDDDDDEEPESGDTADEPKDSTEVPPKGRKAD